MNKKRAAIAVVASLIGASHAVIVNGTAESAYGPALYTQTLSTGFGDSNVASPVLANGSELDSVYGTQDLTSLSLVLGGNLESNYNHLVLFFDTGANGVNTIGSDNASTDDFGFINSLAGTKFDAGFNASYALWVRNGGQDSGNTMYVSLARLGSTTAGGADIFDVNGSGSDTATIRTASTVGFSSALNNANVGGVIGGDPVTASSGAGVTTGFEFSILRSLLGATGSVRVAGFITGGNYLSNQVTGGLPAGTGNLGNSSPTDFSRIAGDQFVTLAAPVPEPSAIFALGLSALTLIRRRRK